MNNIAELREQLTPEDIKSILAQYQVYPYTENSAYIVFPTCCHNLEGGSPKLYYYKNNNLFVCYTHCGTSFDIFELLIKMEKLRGNALSLTEAIKRTGMEINNVVSEDKKEDIKALEYLKRINNVMVSKAAALKEINNSVLDKYVFNEEYLVPWINEGMTIESLKRFNIMYDMNNTAIVIPHKDIHGHIVGIRGRFMDPEAPNKYMPLTYGGSFMAHNLKDNLYGIYENKMAIKKSQTVFIFESEKSVILMDSYFGPEKNYALATCGNKISKEQIGLLQDLGVKEVILCYDKDYRTYNEMLDVQTRYMKICERLANNFKTSIIMDYGNLLNYKDSPIDEGKEVFTELYKYRYYI